MHDSLQGHILVLVISMVDKGQIQTHVKDKMHDSSRINELFVLESSIFSNVFKKDIKRVYLYKKAERLAKALYLLLPAFSNSRVLEERFEQVALRLIDASIQTPTDARGMLSSELLILSSLLGVTKTARIVSSMNIDIILKEVHMLLSEIASYEEPFVSLDTTPSLAELLAESEKTSVSRVRQMSQHIVSPLSPSVPRERKPQPSKEKFSQRQELILALIKDKKEVYIKDISSVLVDISEKTAQRELATLVARGVLDKKGEKRWTTYMCKK